MAFGREAQDENRRQFCDNGIKTSKYTAASFLPLNLFVQFAGKASNAYFLLLSYMQTIKEISISNGQPVMAAPLALVVFVSMLKDAYEDYNRHQSDASENNKKAVVYNGT